jgi:hypothetical protein
MFRKLDVSIFRWRKGDTYSVESLRKSWLSLRDSTEYASPSFHLKTEIYPASETLRFLIIRILDDKVHKPRGSAWTYVVQHLRGQKSISSYFPSSICSAVNFAHTCQCMSEFSLFNNLLTSWTIFIQLDMEVTDNAEAITFNTFANIDIVQWHNAICI